MRDALVSAVNDDGGWGYQAGAASRLEPTCWALLALRAWADSRSSEDAASFLLSCQRADGLLVEHRHLPPNLAFNGLVAIALRAWLAARDSTADVRAIAGRESLLRLRRALIRARGLTLPETALLQQDNGVSGWPWTEDTFSWVEPTSWCALALKQARAFPGEDASASLRARVEDAERVLLDRACREGGWNYGNVAVLSHDLRAYAATTAIALIALQDRGDHPIVRRGLARLRRLLPVEPAGMTLALARMCLRCHGADIAGLDGDLLAMWDRTRFLGNLLTTAVALCAVTPDGDRAFGL